MLIELQFEIQAISTNNIHHQHSNVYITMTLEHSRMFSIFKSSKNKEIEILTRCPNVPNLHLQIHIDPFDYAVDGQSNSEFAKKRIHNSQHENSRLYS